MKIYYLFFVIFLFAVQNSSAQSDTLTGVLLDVNNKVIKNYPVTLGKVSPVTVKTNKYGIFTFPNVDLQDILYVGDKKGKNPIAISINGFSYITIKSVKGNFDMEYLSEPDMQLLRYLQQIEQDKKRNFTGLTSEDIKLSGCYDIYCLLSSFAGVSISNNDGQRDITIVGINNTIRGHTTPLIVINGIPGGGSIDDIPVEEIENITVMKDGSQYGARGANGVILINLKK